MFRISLVPSDMVLIYVCLVFLQLAACSSRTADGYEPKDLSKGQISKFIIPLLDSNARKNDIKVQVVPYYNFKSKKRDKNVKISPLGESKDNKKKDVPVTVILADSKYIKRVNKLSSEESDEHVTHKTLGVEPKRQFTKAPLWEKVEDKFSENDSISDSSLTIEVNRNDVKVSRKTIEEESSQSYSDDSISSESIENEYEDQKSRFKTVNSIDITKSIKDSESSESDVKLFNNFHHASIEKHKQNDNIIKSSKKHINLESNKNILHPHEDNGHLIKQNHSILRSIISKSENTSKQKHNSLKSAKELESSEEILKPLKNHTRLGTNRQSNNQIIILNNFDDIDNRSDNIIRSANSLEDSKSTENNRKALENHERSHINEQSHNNNNNISTLLDYFDHEPSELHKHNESFIKSSRPLESLEENENGISISQLRDDISLSHINLNDSDHDPVNIHKPNDNIIRPRNSSENLESQEVINPGPDSSQINKQNYDDVIPLNSGQVQNLYDSIIKNSKSLEDSANSDISDSHLQVSQHHQEGHDNNSSVYFKNANESIQYYEDASESASEYDLSESSSKDDNVEKNRNNLEEETAEEFVTDIPLTDSYEDFETVKYKVDDLIHPQLSLKVGSGISELEDQHIAFIKGAKLQKLEIKDKSDEIFLPVKNDYPRLASEERSGIKDSSPIEEIDYHSLLGKRDSKVTDNKSSDENSKERSGKQEKNEHILVAPDGVIDEDEYTGKKIFEAIKSYIKKAHELNSKSYNLSFLFNK